jgi:hypothetical protein
MAVTMLDPNYGKGDTGGVPTTTTTDTGNIWGQLFGIVPGVLSAIFPNGIGGKEKVPTVVTGNDGTTTVSLNNSNNTAMIVGIAAVLIVLLLTMKK